MATTFEATVQQLGDRIIVRLPENVSAGLPSRGQVAAEVILDGCDLTTVIEPDGRKGHWIAVDELREVLPLTDGAQVEVAITPTRAWPEPDLPDDFTAALADAPEVHAAWADITPMARWEWVRWVTATRNPETRERRIEVSLDKLRSGSRRPCCFDLSSCTDPELSRSGKLIEASSLPGTPL